MIRTVSTPELRALIIVLFGGILIHASTSSAISGPWDNPPPLPVTGNVRKISTVNALYSAVNSISSNQTILLAPGEYVLNKPLVFNNKKQAVTGIALRGATGKREDVVIRGAGMRDKSVGFAVQIFNCQDVLIADLSIGEVYNHPIQLQGAVGASRVRIYNCRLFNAGEQFVKSHAADDGILEYSVIEFTDTSRWYYTEGIDVHKGKRWIVRHNLFRNIRGPANDPRVGAAILFWNGSADNIADGNYIYNCRYGIKFGITNKRGFFDCQGGVIRNNIFYREAGAVNDPDTAIMVWNSPNTKVLHNTVILNGTPGAMVSWQWCTGVLIANNLTDGSKDSRFKTIWKREDAEGEIRGNYLSAKPDMFRDFENGDLHLTQKAGVIINRGELFDDCTTDFDGATRPAGNKTDIGADEFGADSPASDTLSQNPKTAEPIKLSLFSKKERILTADPARAKALRAELIPDIISAVESGAEATLQIPVFGRMTPVRIAGADDDVLELELDDDIVEKEWADIDTATFFTILDATLSTPTPEQLQRMALFHALSGDPDGFAVIRRRAAALSDAHAAAVESLIEKKTDTDSNPNSDGDAPEE